MKKGFILFIIMTAAVTTAASGAHAREVADPLDTHARLVIGVGTDNWNRNSNIDGVQNINAPTFIGYLEEDAEGLYLAYHVTLSGGGLGSVTFMDGTKTSNTFMTNLNMDFQGVCYTTKGIAVMLGPYIGLTAAGMGGASSNVSTVKGDAEGIIISTLGASLRVHSFIGDYIELALQGFYGFWTPYSNLTVVSASTGPLGGTNTIAYSFDNISDLGLGFQLGIRIMRQIGVVVGIRYEDTRVARTGKNMDITNLNSLLALGLWF